MLRSVISCFRRRSGCNTEAQKSCIEHGGLRRLPKGKTKAGRRHPAAASPAGAGALRAGEEREGGGDGEGQGDDGYDAGADEE